MGCTPSIDIVEGGGWEPPDDWERPTKPRLRMHFHAQNPEMRRGTTQIEIATIYSHNICYKDN